MFIKQWLKQSHQERTCRLIFDFLNTTTTTYVEKTIGESIYKIPVGFTKLYDEKHYKKCYQQLLNYEWDYDLEQLMERYLEIDCKVQTYYESGREIKGANPQLATYIFAVFNNLVEEKCI